jgi:hypothetical protein
LKVNNLMRVTLGGGAQPLSEKALKDEFKIFPKD